MTRRAPIPFDPDALGGAVRVHGAVQGETMLSEVLESQDWQGESAAPVESGAKGVARPLSNRQKWLLSDLAEAVYDFLRKQGELKGEDLKSYRRRIAEKACGKRISLASHGDYKLIQAALLTERGRLAEARGALVQAAATPAAIAMNAIMKLCRDTGTPTQHAHTLAARFYKGAELTALTDKQLWTVFYTIRNNANAKAGVGQKANRFKSKRRKSL